MQKENSGYKLYGEDGGLPLIARRAAGWKGSSAQSRMLQVFAAVYRCSEADYGDSTAVYGGNGAVYGGHAAVHGDSAATH
eukprot:2881420-Rhodomonas_salina.3